MKRRSLPRHYGLGLTEQIQVRYSKEQLAALESIADREGVHVSTVIRRATMRHYGLEKLLKKELEAEEPKGKR
jgi:hypothetical protein